MTRKAMLMPSARTWDTLNIVMSRSFHWSFPPPDRRLLNAFEVVLMPPLGLMPVEEAMMQRAVLKKKAEVRSSWNLRERP